MEHGQIAIAEHLAAWKQPAALISARMGGSIELDRLQPSFPVPSSFPFFERADFLFDVESEGEVLSRLTNVSRFVKARQRQTDQDCCKIVLSLCEYFSTDNGRILFRHYAANCVRAFEEARSADLDQISDEQVLALIERVWLLNHPSIRECLLRYGHEAVTLLRIFRTAHQGDGDLKFDESSLEKWATEVSACLTAFRYFLERWIPMLRGKSDADVHYFALRVASYPFPPILDEKGNVVENGIVNDPKLEFASFAELNRRLRGLVGKYQKVSGWKGDLAVQRKDGGYRSAEEIAEVEIPFAIGKAIGEDRASTPRDGWLTHVLGQFRESQPAPIVTRVQRDLSDIIDHEQRKTGEQGFVDRSIDIADLVSDLLKDASPATKAKRVVLFDTLSQGQRDEINALNIRLKLDSFKHRVCRTKFDEEIWELRFVEGLSLKETVEKLRASTGKKYSAGRISQVAKELLARAKSQALRQKTRIRNSH